MPKKYIVRLSAEERNILQTVIKKLSGSSQKVRRAQMLIKADAAGSAWTDARIAEAFNCRVKTVEPTSTFCNGWLQGGPEWQKAVGSAHS